jgi:hypothetical protein
MTVRHQAMAFAAAAFFFAGAAGAATAPTPSASASLCNAQGKVEVLNEPADVDCGTGPQGEMKAISRARSQYDSGNYLGAEKRAMIEARIDRRMRELRDEIHRSRG